MNLNSPHSHTGPPHDEPPPAYHDDCSAPSINDVTFRYTSTDHNEHAQPPPPQQQQQQQYQPYSPNRNNNNNNHGGPTSPYIFSMNGPMPDPYQQHTYSNSNTNNNTNTNISPYQVLTHGSFAESSGSPHHQQHYQPQTHYQFQSAPPLPPRQTSHNNHNTPNKPNNINTNNYKNDDDDDDFLFVHHGSQPRSPHSVQNPPAPNQYQSQSNSLSYLAPQNQQPLPPQQQPRSPQNENNLIFDENDPDYDPFLVLNALQTLSQPPAPNPQQYSHNQQPHQQQQQQQQAPLIPPKPKTNPTTTVNDLIQSGQLIPPLEDFECPICAEMTFIEFFRQEFAFLGCFPGDMDEFRVQCPALQLSTCLHTFCFSCLTAYVTNYIESDLVQAQIKRIPCMESDCGAWITQTELRAILTQAEYAKFEQQQLEWSSLGQENMYKCITPNCPAIIEKAGDLIGDERTGRLNPKLICPQCHVPQCVKCGIAWHMNQTCKEYKTKLAEQDAVKSSTFLSKAADFDASSPQFRQCPRCAIMIEKVTGCDKVKCLCGYGMCWVCGSPGAKCQCTKGNHVFYDNVTGHGTRDISNK